jgi:hypothetical protein
MPRVLIVIFGVVVLLVVASELLIPAFAEREVEQRLEENGGSASADVDAFPAVRLLFGDGDRLAATGQNLTLDVAERQRVLERLDGFDEVQIELADFRVGPFQLDGFVMTRAEGRPNYRTAFSGEASPREVASFLGTEAGGLFGGLLGGLAAGTLPGGGTTPLPVELTAVVKSNDGRVEVTRTRGSVAGVPAGPFAQLVIEMVVRRL